MINLKKAFEIYVNEAIELLLLAKLDVFNKKNYIEKFKKYEISTFLNIEVIKFNDIESLEFYYNKLKISDKYYYVEKIISKNENFDGHILIGNLRENIEKFPLLISFKKSITWKMLGINSNNKNPFIETKILEEFLKGNLLEKDFIEYVKNFHLNK
jgi:hypothetical protein